MARHRDTILLLEHHTEKSSLCAGALASLGYGHVVYANYSRTGGVMAIQDRIDAVVAVWTDEFIDFHTVLRVVGKGTELPKARGALIVSPFSTEENASQLRHCGARAWVRYPFLTEKFGRRLRYILDGERRLRAEPIADERRLDPVYPLAEHALGRLQLPVRHAPG